MNRGWIAVVAALMGAPQALAQSPPPETAEPAAADAQPWIKAQDLVKSIQADAKVKGILAVEPHVSEMERALAEGPRAFGMVAGPDGTATVLTDGAAETLVALAAVPKGAGSRKVVAVDNPYPLISLYLGSYYDEIGKYDDALRVLDAGLKLYAVPDLKLGETLPVLISERGAALIGLKRWDAALANYDDGLKIANMSDRDRARLFRGRGFALTELRQLDDAEQAYKNSLNLEPNNPRALNELAYIARLRAGGLAEPGKLSLPPKSQ